MTEKWKTFQQYGIDDDARKKYFYWAVIEDKPLPADVIVTFPRENPNANGYGDPTIQAHAELIASAPALLAERDALKAQRDELLEAGRRVVNAEPGTMEWGNAMGALMTVLSMIGGAS